MSFHCSREVFPCRAACKIGTGSSTARSTTWPLKSVPGVSSPPPQSAVLRFRAASRLPSDVTFDLFLWLLLKGGKHAIPCCSTEAADKVFYNACSGAAGLRGAILPERLLHVGRFLNLRDALIFTVSVKAKSHRFIQTIGYFGSAAAPKRFTRFHIAWCHSRAAFCLDLTPSYSQESST